MSAVASYEYQPPPSPPRCTWDGPCDLCRHRQCQDCPDCNPWGELL